MKSNQLRSVFVTITQKELIEFINSKSPERILDDEAVLKDAIRNTGAICATEFQNELVLQFNSKLP